MRTAAIVFGEMNTKRAQIRAKTAEADAFPLLPKTSEERQAFDRITREHEALCADFDVLAAEHAGLQGAYGSASRAHGGEREQRRAAVEDAILHRANPRRYKLTGEAREFAASSLVELARDVMEAEGVSTRGLSRPEIAQRSLMTTSDFPLTLANVVGRSLRDSYQASPRTFQAFCKQTTLSDFKVAHRVKVGDLPQLLQVQENGEFKRGAMGEGDEQIKLNTFGRIVGITRQVIMNDDLGAFTKLPQQFGISAANLESNIMWGLIMSNPVLFTDSTPVFHAKHNNLKTGATSALIQGIDTFEYAYLDGQDGPYTEQRNGWDIDGLEVKCRHDFGAAAIDYRGAVYSAGA